jgi:hypothetical protein
MALALHVAVNFITALAHSTRQLYTWEHRARRRSSSSMALGRSHGGLVRTTGRACVCSLAIPASLIPTRKRTWRVPYLRRTQPGLSNDDVTRLHALCYFPALTRLPEIN